MVINLSMCSCKCRRRTALFIRPLPGGKHCVKLPTRTAQSVDALAVPQVRLPSCIFWSPKSNVKLPETIQVSTTPIDNRNHGKLLFKGDCTSNTYQF